MVTLVEVFWGVVLISAIVVALELLRDWRREKRWKEEEGKAHFMHSDRRGNRDWERREK